MDTIFALATAQGKAGVAIIRISGPKSFDVCKMLCGGVPTSHHASVKSIKNQDGELIDKALVLSFADGKSFTGEDVIEFHLHGSGAIISVVLAELGKIPGLRLAEPGEFTRRALENNKLDLFQVEGLADLIDAETEAQRRHALRLMEGEFGQKAKNWRTDLIKASALITALLDFSEEEIPDNLIDDVLNLVSAVRGDLDREIAGSKVGERLREGFEVAIVGPPNVGKSTLLNALAGREAAITSEYAGTTRDIIEVRMDLDGIPVTFLDTAGLRKTDDPVENIGISRAKERATNADIRIFLTENGLIELDVLPHDIVLKPKADLLDNPSGAISGATGFGIDELIKKIKEQLTERTSIVGIANRERHRLGMIEAFTSLDKAQEYLMRTTENYDLIAEELRRALHALEFLLGSVGVEDLLDQIFSEFCIGK